MYCEFLCLDLSTVDYHVQLLVGLTISETSGTNTKVNRINVIRLCHILNIRTCIKLVLKSSNNDFIIS